VARRTGEPRSIFLIVFRSTPVLRTTAFTGTAGRVARPNRSAGGPAKSAEDRQLGAPSLAFSACPEPREGSSALGWGSSLDPHLRPPAQTLPGPRRPVRLDLDHTRPPRQVVPVAAPLPAFRILHQASPHRIPVDVPQLLYPLLLAPHVEVIVARLPEVPADLHSSPCHGLLHRLHCHRQRFPLRLSHQQMHVFRHYHITDYPEAVATTSRFQRVRKQCAGRRVEQLHSPVATTGYVV